MNMSDVLIQSGRVNLSNRDKELGEEIKLDENFDINATKTEEDYKKELLDNISSLDDEGMTSDNALSIVSGITGVMGWNSISLQVLSNLVIYYFGNSAFNCCPVYFCNDSTSNSNEIRYLFDEISFSPLYGGKYY